MYSKLPNLVLAFHGCDAKVFDAVIREGKQLKPSKNDYDWLGHGAYFWEQNLERAQQWADEQQNRGRIDTPSVIGAVIDLGHCLNLMDSEYIDLLAEEYRFLRDELEAAGFSLPTNKGKSKDKLFRNLDCEVIQHLHTRLKKEAELGRESLPPFDSVRALFVEGDPIYKGAGFRKKTHVQICVRNPNCIKGYFDPREPNRRWPIP